MKKSPEEANLEDRLKPSIFSGGGFLGHDDRPINEIIADDLKALEEETINKNDLEKLLEKAFKQVKQGWGQKIQLSENLYGTFYESKGKIPSPFRGDGVFEKGEARIIHQKEDQELIITDLSLNLIKKHDFFQGKGSRYRINPVQAYYILQEMKQA